MSYVAIAAALALEDVSGGERLAVFSLASFANREQRAWPGTRVAAARAGLSRSQYFAACDVLQKRGLMVVEDSGGGRGNSSVVALAFARRGPWFEAQVNAPLFEAVLSYSRARRSARLLLATLAALANDELVVSEVATDELRAAAGMADSTYRRARAALLASGEAVLDVTGGGRAKTNRWRLADPRPTDPQRVVAPRRRVGPSPAARPLIATVRPPQPTAEDQLDLPIQAAAGERTGSGSTGVSISNPGQNRTVSDRKGPGLSGVSTLNPGQDRTVCRETPPQTPPETPPPNAHAGREPQNPRIRQDPPNPPEGGSRQLVSIVEDYVTPRGRQRHRTVTVDLDDVRSHLLSPRPADHAGWQQIRADLESAVGGAMFAIWLAPLELVGCDDGGVLLLACPAAIRQWVSGRHAAVLELVSRSRGRSARLASDRELQLLVALAAAGAETPSDDPLPQDRQEAI